MKTRAPRVQGDWPKVSSRFHPLAVTIGVFDGVHRGHRHVLEQVKRTAAAIGGRSAVVAFEQHPLQVLRPQAAPAVLTGPQEKLARLKASGVDFAFVVPFTRRLARVKAAHFLRQHLVGDLGTRCLVVGANFNFGHRREGDIAYLRRVGPHVGCAVRVVPALRMAGARVSSTHIRRLIAGGKMGEAARFLGHPHLLTGVVKSGDGLGRKLGFPTANLHGIPQMLPAFGVYVVRVRGGRPGVAWGGVANIGIRPTLGKDKAPRVEVHLLKTPPPLRDARLEVEVVHRLRSERRFPTLEALARQIRRDKDEATRWLKGRGR